MSNSAALIDVFTKITGGYQAFLIVSSLILNPMVLIVCLKSKHLRSNSTFKLLAFNSINDMITCFGWNFEGFVFSFFGYRPFFANLFYCRVISVFVQFYTVEFSSWMLISISLDRLLSMSIKTWSKQYFTGYRPFIFSLVLTVIMMAINFHMIFYSGYILDLNGVQMVICYTTPPELSVDWYRIMTQVYIYFGFIVPYGILIILNVLIVYKATQFERAQKAALATRTVEETRSAKRKAEMTRTILILTFIYIALNMPNTIAGGYFYLTILFLPAGQIIVNLINGLKFSVPALNFFILFFSNKLFAKEVKFIVFKLKGNVVSFASGTHHTQPHLAKNNLRTQNPTPVSN